MIEIPRIPWISELHVLYVKLSIQFLEKKSFPVIHFIIRFLYILKFIPIFRKSSLKHGKVLQNTTMHIKNLAISEFEIFLMWLLKQLLRSCNNLICYQCFVTFIVLFFEDWMQWHAIIYFSSWFTVQKLDFTNQYNLLRIYCLFFIKWKSINWFLIHLILTKMCRNYLKKRMI